MQYSINSNNSGEIHPKNKSEYFDISNSLNIEKRCPILQICARREITININNDYKFSDDIFKANKIIPAINNPYYVGGNTSYIMGNLCPEVSLFEPENTITSIYNMPATRFSYDKYMIPPYEILETAHYSECAEYSSYTTDIYRKMDILKQSNDPFDTLERISRKLPATLASLKRRRQPRAPVIINDEYDIQYIFIAILRIHFDDIRIEENTPSVSGGSGRADCLLKTENIIIEFKMTRSGYKSTQLRKEADDDFVLYGSHPDCKGLFIFVYDPDKHIENPEGVEKDLSQPRAPLKKIRTFIQQS